MRISLVLVTLCGILMTGSGAPAGSDGSKCPNVSCSPPIPGAQCTAKYERDDRCCPVWYCNKNGATSTIYGKSTGSSSSSFSSSSFSNNNGPNFGRMPPMGGGLPGFTLPNLGNLFG